MIGQGEDLRAFFVIGEFAESVRIEYASGRVDTIAGIFDDPASVAALGGSSERDVSRPTLQVIEADVEGLKRGDQLIVRGKAYKSLGAPLGDGTGLAVVELAKA